MEHREDGILHVCALPGVGQSADDARENLSIARQLIANEAVRVLVDARQSGILEREARATYAAEAEFVIAQALIVGSAFTRIAGNMFVRVASAKIPTRVFTSEEAALRWLKEFEA